MGIKLAYYGIGLLRERVLDNCILEDFSRDNIGPCFVSVKNPNLIPVKKSIITKGTVYNLAQIIMFHYVVNETDCHDGNLQYDLANDCIVCIDSSHILDKNTHKSPEELIKEYTNESSLLYSFEANRDLYEVLNIKQNKDLAKDILQKAQEVSNILSEDAIHNTIFSIPPEWEERVGKDVLYAYKEIIIYRTTRIHKAAIEIISEGGY